MPDSMAAPNVRARTRRSHTDASAPAASKPATVDQLLERISGEYEGLSRQLKVIGRHIERHRDRLGLDGIQQVAAQCEVQPSAVVRFAKHFGFSGFAELQRMFRAGIARQIAPSRNYQGRIRDVIASGAGTLSSADIAHEFLGGSVAGMQELQRSLQAPTLKKAVDLLARADTIWIVGARRSFAVAVYLDYALQHTDKRICLISALGSMQDGAVRSVRKGDVLIAISFSPYAPETLAVARVAVDRGATLLAITDSGMGELGRLAHVVLKVEEHATFGFRALTSTMGLAQSLFIALAYRLELSYTT
jgi:DNA-binding MurR/RpiR family transcriptional regulator